MDFYSASLEIKAVDVSQRIISGYAAVHHNIDRVRDIIDPAASAKAVRRLKDPKLEIPVFIGHKSNELSMGHPITVQATPRGLYTETYIYQGSDGDNLLAKARDMQAHGVPLGMSIGFKTHDSRMEHTARGRVRRLLDYELKEYSFAAHQTIANPEALTTGVKARRRKALSEGSDSAGGMLVPPDRKETGMQYRVTQDGGKWAVYCDADNDGDADDNRLVGSYASEEIANAVVAALRAEGVDDDDGDAPDGKTMSQEAKAVWTGKYVDSLPNSSFLYVEPGDDDGEGKRVPRSKRHFPYKDANGKVDVPHLRNAIARIPQGNAPGLDDGKKASLQARARALLEKESGGMGNGKTLDLDAPEWKGGVPLSLRALGYRLLDLSEQIATEQKAMVLLGEDTKEYHRVRPPVRDDLTLVGLELKRLVDWCATIERGEDELATVARYRALVNALDI